MSTVSASAAPPASRERGRAAWLDSVPMWAGVAIVSRAERPSPTSTMNSPSAGRRPIPSSTV
jgi:hypothetical protein